MAGFSSRLAVTRSGMADPVKNAKGNGVENGTAKADSVKTAGAKGGTAAKAAASDAAATTGDAVATTGNAVKTVGAAKDKVLAAGSRTATLATVGVTAVKERRKIAAGAGGGLVMLLAGAFAVGRASARRRTGPLTRLTNGRI